ncbi:MAG: HupE/UreJ family protein [Alphaproteobacteria bacterium]|uniref:HupE/UreJ family protein n=1 Tax=Pacificispira sp. TaxID=2888761 RepID=UPI001B1B0FC8|nr:HupE/UreJ family protein [Alphaproteobacteria bacterium]MBO6864117.1 HupE/UreJ family protein [Alphaproteobacteria bacterium]
MIDRWSQIVTTAAFLVLISATAATAHEGAGHGGGFISGLTHPIFGLDHVIAMVAVGLWGVFLGRPALFILPIVFPLIMAFGGAMGVLGIPVPAVEAGIAASAVVLGLLIAFAVKAPLPLAAAIVGVFAIFHGHAHGTELPESASAATYSIGFVLSTGMLHLVGIGLGEVMRGSIGRIAARGLGGIIALMGAAFLTGLA